MEAVKANINGLNYEKKWIHFVAISLFVMGFINILSAWLSFDYLRLNILKDVLEYHIILGSRYLVIITGIMSMLIAPALYRQKRVAWYISIFLLAISGFAHIFKGADIEEASMCILLVGILLPMYKHCFVKSDPVRVQHSGWIFLAAILFVITYTFIGIHVFASNLGDMVKDIPAWRISVDALFFDISLLQPVGIEAKFFVDSLLAINSFAIILGASFALSPVIARQLPDINYDKYKSIAKNNAIQPVQFFTLSGDYQHFYLKNDEGESILSYSVANRVAMAIGNPCGTLPVSYITEKWIDYVREHDWIPAVYQAQGEFLKELKAVGFSAVPVGVEAVVRLADFKLEGKAMQNLRTAKNKATKEGWTIRPYEEKDWEKVKKIDYKWLEIHGKSENTFAMGKSSAKYLSETRSTLLFDKDNNLLAYINNVELPGIKGRAVDLMRKDPDSPKGVMDVLFVHEILAAKEEGLDFYDLGFSPLAKVDDSLTDNNLVVKLFKLIFDKQRRYYDFQGLHQFKSKFLPEWQMSHLVYPSQLTLPNVLVALLSLNNN